MRNAPVKMVARVLFPLGQAASREIEGTEEEVCSQALMAQLEKQGLANLDCGHRIQQYSRQSRRMARPNQHGFPNGKPKTCSTIEGFGTGDLAKALVATGKKQGIGRGRVAVRASGNFRVGKHDGIAARFLAKLQHSDGYQYQIPNAFLPAIKDMVSSATIR